MKTYIKQMITLLTLVLIVSCDDYLDVKPEDKFLEEQVFESKKTILGALNGIYTNMTSIHTYGGSLTMSAVDVLGQQYKTPGSHKWDGVSRYNYEDPFARTTFNGLWTTQYTTILGINNFLAGLDKYPGVLTPEEENLVKGEVYGLRAMLHFDLLRLFGPIYSVSPDSESIPYSLDNSGNTQELLSANEVIKLVLEDLDAAETFLANDVIIQYGPLNVGLALIEEDEDKFLYSRQYRLNYYAVKALQARVNLYAGNKEEAFEAATFVIDNASQWFPWTEGSEIFTNAANPDRTFSKEVIFGLVNTSLYGRHNTFFAPSLADGEILAADQDILFQRFESTLDYRYETTWKQPENNAKAYKTFLKYADVSDTRMFFRFKQPLIRMTEMYYIAAETELDQDVAAQYINTVRNKRGIAGTIEPSNLQAEILKEYRKEFYGEGQLFFYYKRLNVPTLNSGTKGGPQFTMEADQYVVPLPLSETDYRN